MCRLHWRTTEVLGSTIFDLGVKGFSSIYFLSQTLKMYKKWVRRRLHTQLSSQTLGWDLHDKSHAVTVQMVLFQMVSKVLLKWPKNFDHIFYNTAILTATKHQSLKFIACHSPFLSLSTVSLTVLIVPLKWYLSLKETHNTCLFLMHMAESAVLTSSSSCANVWAGDAHTVGVREK